MGAKSQEPGDAFGVVEAEPEPTNALKS